MKKYIKLIIITCMMFLLTGCTSAPLDVEEIKESEEVVSYFQQMNVSITDIELEKRQTNKDKKEDIAYVKIKAENEKATLEGEYIISSSYFDEGGWVVMSIASNKGGTYRPKDMIVCDVLDWYWGATSVDYTDYEILQYDTTANEYRGNLFFTVHYEGNCASISEDYSMELKFDIYEGEWKSNARSVLIDGNCKIFLEDGIYVFKDTNRSNPARYELEFSNVNAKLTYHEWDDKYAYDEQMGYIGGYKQYNLGISGYRIEDGAVYLEEFGNIYGRKPCFKIEPNEIYYDLENLYWQGGLEYNTKLERIE